MDKLLLVHGKMISFMEMLSHLLTQYNIHMDNLTEENYKDGQNFNQMIKY